MNRHFSFKYGRGQVQFDVPDEQILCEMRGNDRDAPADILDVYRQALDNPQDSPPLRELVHPGERVLITVSDITRGWQRNDRLLPTLLDYLNSAGISDRDITIVIAVGAHRLNTHEEFVELCGEQACHRVTVVNHDCRDYDRMDYYGRTSRGTEVLINRLVREHDRLITTGGITYHHAVGYAGGRKSIMPGISSLKTIQQCHMWCFNSTVGTGAGPMVDCGITSGNPAHEDMMEVAAFSPPTFIINMVPNFQGDSCAVFAGNWISAWWRGVALVEEMYGVPIQEPADIVIATAGGYPNDINLYQSQKTIHNAVAAMKPGGAAIIMAECPDFGEPAELVDWFEHPSYSEMEQAVRANFLISGFVAVRLWQDGEKGTVILLTRPENTEKASRAKMTACADMKEALALAYKACGTSKPSVTLMPYGAHTWPIMQCRQ
ncbi:MAG: nickel-dependent lactate racemase [Dehalococcoidia bacterium]|jgi:nickel-dependent lactate racemase|nr:nickel-dependent lactate racemase [Dehalococcoidia bacterium]